MRAALASIGGGPEVQAILDDAPRRVLEGYREFFSGVGQDAVAMLRGAVLDATETSDLVIVKDLAFRSICEHHLLPFGGTATVAYVPDGRIVGLSALPRAIDVLAARPQIQERLGEQIADAILQGVAPGGVLVLLEAVHGCLGDRGVRQSGATVVSLAARGVLRESGERAVVLMLAGRGSRS